MYFAEALCLSVCLWVHMKSFQASEMQTCWHRPVWILSVWNKIITLSPLISKLLRYQYLLKIVLCLLFLLYFFLFFTVWSPKNLFHVHFIPIVTQCGSSLIHIYPFISPPSSVLPGELNVFDRQPEETCLTKQPYTAYRPPDKIIGWTYLCLYL